MNLIVLHWPTNHIHLGFDDVTCDERLLIEHRYSGHQWYVMNVCNLLFDKYVTLRAKYENLSISQLTRVSKSFLGAIKQLEPVVRRCHRRERMVPYGMSMSL